MTADSDSNRTFSHRRPQQLLRGGAKPLKEAKRGRGSIEFAILLNRYLYTETSASKYFALETQTHSYMHAVTFCNVIYLKLFMGAGVP